MTIMLQAAMTCITMVAVLHRLSNLHVAGEIAGKQSVLKLTGT